MNSRTIAEQRIKEYYDAIRDINILQSRLELYTKNRIAVKIALAEHMQNNGAADNYDKHQRELTDLEAQVFDTAALIREKQQCAIVVHSVLEQLAETELQFVELRCRAKKSMEYISVSMSMTKSPLYRFRDKVYDKIYSLL